MLSVYDGVAIVKSNRKIYAITNLARIWLHETVCCSELLKICFSIWVVRMKCVLMRMKWKYFCSHLVWILCASTAKWWWSLNCEIKITAIFQLYLAWLLNLDKTNAQAASQLLKSIQQQHVQNLRTHTQIGVYVSSCAILNISATTHAICYCLEFNVKTFKYKSTWEQHWESA